MAQPANPPDGWSVVDGSWSTDFQRDTSVYVTSGSSFLVTAGSLTTQTMRGPWFALDEGGVPYVATAILRATNSSSLFTLKLEIYAGDQTTLTNTIYLYNNQAVPTAAAWQTASTEFVTAAGYSWARFVLTRASGATSAINIDRVEVKKLGPRWGLYKSVSTGDQAYVGSNQLITFDQVDYSSLVTPASSLITIYRAGLYQLYLRLNVEVGPSPAALNVSFRANDPTYGVISLGTVQYVNSQATNYTFQITHSTLYRHVGTRGAGTSIGAYVSGAGTVKASPSGISTNGNTAITAWTGVWLGLG